VIEFGGYLSQKELDYWAGMCDPVPHTKAAGKYDAALQHIRWDNRLTLR